MFIYLARVRGAAFADKLKQELGLPPTGSGPGPMGLGWDTRVRSRMHQRLDRSRYEAIGDEEVLFDAELHVAQLEVTRTILLYAMAKRQVLSPRRCADWVGLHKPQLVESAF